jgi:hypothetical protein
LDEVRQEWALHGLPQRLLVDDRPALDLVGVLGHQSGVLHPHRACRERLDLHQRGQAGDRTIRVAHEVQVIDVEVDLVVPDQFRLATVTELTLVGYRTLPRLIAHQTGPRAPQVTHLTEPALPLLVLRRTCRPDGDQLGEHAGHSVRGLGACDLVEEHARAGFLDDLRDMDLVLGPMVIPVLGVLGNHMGPDVLEQVDLGLLGVREPPQARGHALSSTPAGSRHATSPALRGTTCPPHLDPRHPD